MPDSQFLPGFHETNPDLSNHTVSNGNRSTPTRFGSCSDAGTGTALFGSERQARVSLALA
jgi:hypothetical protein